MLYAGGEEGRRPIMTRVMSYMGGLFDLVSNLQSSLGYKVMLTAWGEWGGMGEGELNWF
jgi:hypothetical protein